MSERHLIREIYGVEVDAADWPVGLTEETKAALTEIVLCVLRDCSPLSTFELFGRVRDTARRDNRCAAFNEGALLDWLYGCVVRAARAGECEQRWHPPKRSTRITEGATAAIGRLAKRYGRRWKAELRGAWANGNYAGIGVDEDDAAELQQLRNTGGPSALNAIRTPKG